MTRMPEFLSPNQLVGGSNPSGRASYKLVIGRMAARCSGHLQVISKCAFALVTAAEEYQDSSSHGYRAQFWPRHRAALAVRLSD